jgi:hypothetical protein
MVKRVPFHNNSSAQILLITTFQNQVSQLIEVVKEISAGVSPSCINND